jgi:murein DD-endopeptidase MepM/ murein hydrolase activator NlpD
MFSFLSDLLRSAEGVRTVLVMDDEHLDQPRRYHVRPRSLRVALSVAAFGIVLLAIGLVAFTPLRQWVPGYSTDEIRRDARLNALRVEALQDSLEAQWQYLSQLRRLMTGQIDSSSVAEADPAEPLFPVAGTLAEVAASPASDNWTDHRQPALPVSRMPVAEPQAVPAVAVEKKYLSSLHFPVLPPLNGLFTRGFDARAGHYAVDVAVEEGTVVRAIGDGYVIFADWTHEGGYAISVQHADGFVSTYKHNQRLLKRVGDRVRDREAIAMSGNTGEVTTGPHLHFELWHDGLAQDPHFYFIGK